jgi:hypothetical protein
VEGQNHRAHSRTTDSVTLSRMVMRKTVHSGDLQFMVDSKSLVGLPEKLHMPKFFSLVEVKVSDCEKENPYAHLTCD